MEISAFMGINTWEKHVSSLVVHCRSHFEGNKQYEASSQIRMTITGINILAKSNSLMSVTFGTFSVTFLFSKKG